MEEGLKNFQKNPMKLYIQDIYRAKRTPENKYIYELFGLTFKNIMIHGVITSVYNKTDKTTNLELSDPTGTIQIYYNCTKNNKFISKDALKDLHRDVAHLFRFGDNNIDIKLKMMDAICSSKKNPFNFDVGGYLCIIGDIFIDDMRNIRMVSAYECQTTSMENDVVWLEELRYLYEKFYLWDKVD